MIRRMGELPEHRISINGESLKQDSYRGSTSVNGYPPEFCLD